MDMFVGTSGYSYKEWRGRFYPEKMKPDAMLRFYAERFDTVEVNNSFYRMPDPEMLANWALNVPGRFEFAVKAPRRITHIKRLRDADEDVAEFVRRASVLGQRLGPLLFQLPPFAKLDLPLLDDFLARVPPGLRLAFEFRHASWFVDEVYAALRRRDAMLCVAQADELEVPLVATSTCGYLRLRSLDYDDASLRGWAERIAAEPWQRAYVYFKHEDEALGPKFAQRFRALWADMMAIPDQQRSSEASSRKRPTRAQ